MDLAEIERRTCDLAARQLGIARERVTPESRLLADLHCDSLDFVELLMELEEEFTVTMRETSPDPIFKSVFARAELTLGDLAESIYLSLGASGDAGRRGTGARATMAAEAHSGETVAFTQLGGRWRPGPRTSGSALYERLGCEEEGTRAAGKLPCYRRRSDGMRCVVVPAAVVEIGSDAIEAEPDEQPVHLVSLDAYLLDMEPVSVTAYCRFLNSIMATHEDLSAWILLSSEDDRGEHLPVRRVGVERWEPVDGTAEQPMVMVSWYGANAYSRWANGADWRRYREDAVFLPSEAQWEYAARGTARLAKGGAGAGAEAVADATAVVGAEPVYGRHVRGARYEGGVLPMSPVHERRGLSPWGMHHMSGNVWHWCRDWYDGGFYGRLEAVARNPVGCRETGVRSERGGSWVGPKHLTRTSHRRGREPAARGRCLGFRCCANVPAELP